ncbi:MAG TPA: hypothetical protein VGC26_06160 [Afipia sp.]
MFFKRPKLTYSPALDGPNILALSSDAELSEIRIRPFLSSLLARGVIASYQFADRKMTPIGWCKTGSFTHIWCHRNVSTEQYRFLRKHALVPIIYDIDDLLTDVPEFVMKRRARTIERIDWCLNHANVVATATEPLKKALRDKVPSGTDILVLKNGHAGYQPPRRPEPRKQIVWTSGDLPFVVREYPNFMADLARIVNSHDYEMILIGRFDSEYERMFDRCRHIQRLDFASYREFLRFNAGAIALAPLPSGLPDVVQRFFDAKSDIKLVDYLSAGMVPVFTSTPPYSESELFIPQLAAPDPGGLLKVLEKCITNHAAMIESIDTAIHATKLLQNREFIELSKVLDHIFE